MAGNPQEMTVPPVEGVAGGGTAYGWSDGVMLSSNRLQGSIDPTEVPSADLLHVWCMPSTANIGPQEMPRPLEHVSILCFSVSFLLPCSSSSFILHSISPLFLTVTSTSRNSSLSFLDTSCSTCLLYV